MYLLYVDESGDPYQWGEQDNFVLAGVAVHESQVFHLGKQLDDIQTKFFPNHQIPLGFHANEIRAGRGVSRKLAPEARSQLMKSIYSCISDAEFPRLVAFATSWNVSKAKTPA